MRKGWGKKLLYLFHPRVIKDHACVRAYIEDASRSAEKLNQTIRTNAAEISKLISSAIKKNENTHE